MHHLMMNLPVVGTLGVVALLAGPLARLPIVAGAWLLESACTTAATIGARTANPTRSSPLPRWSSSGPTRHTLRRLRGVRYYVGA